MISAWYLLFCEHNFSANTTYFLLFTITTERFSSENETPVKHQTRRELLDLVEALIEGAASPGDYARLEELVLSDSDCQTLYLQAIELHGSLYWDAAGIGSTHFEDNFNLKTLAHPVTYVDQNRHASSSSTRNSRNVRRTWVALSAAAVLLLGVFFFNQNRYSSLIEDNLAQTFSLDSPLSEETILEPIPELKLPNTPLKPVEALVINSPAAPPVTDANILTTTTDAAVVAFINQQLEQAWTENEVQPAPTSTDEEWVRRVHLDLAGRIPTQLETASFLKDHHPDKRSQLVDALIDTQDFARHFAGTWTNLLVGRSRNSNINRDRLLGYLENQFGNNRSWRETVSSLITATGSAEESGPANFLLAHLNNEAVPATAITARTLLCQQLQCAQCHTHPSIREWGQERFWEFNAFFQQTSVKEETIVDQETGEKIRLRTLVDSNKLAPTYYDTLKGVTQIAYPELSGQKIEEQTDRPLRESLADLLTSGDRPQLAKAFINRNWAQFFGYGFTPQVDDMGPHSPVSHPQLLEGLAEAFVKSGYDTHRLIKWICLSEAYQLSSKGSENIDTPEDGDPALFSRMYVKPLSAEQLFDSLLIASGVSPAEMHRRGQTYAQREEWLQQFFKAVDNEENSEQSTFDGTVPQALMMMNGELVQRAIDPNSGVVFRNVVSDPHTSELSKIRALSLAALSRYPTPEETTAIRNVLRGLVKSQTEQNVPPQLAVNEGLRDIYWAYLNSSEFAINH